MEDWRRLWRDKQTPPYEILRVQEFYRHRAVSGQTAVQYTLYYRTYKRAVTNLIYAIDELDAFIKGTALMARLKAKTDKHKEQTPCS